MVYKEDMWVYSVIHTDSDIPDGMYYICGPPFSLNEQKTPQSYYLLNVNNDLFDI